MLAHQRFQAVRVLLVQELVVVPLAHHRALHAIERARVLLPRVDVLAVALPEVGRQLLHAGVQQVGVFDRLVAVVVLGVHADDRGLDAQVDVLRHQRDARVREFLFAARASGRGSRCRRRARAACPASRRPAPWSGRTGGRSTAASCRRSRTSPAGSSRPRSICPLVAFAISSSRKRLTWRTLRAASDRPFLPASSSSSTIIGM